MPTVEISVHPEALAAVSALKATNNPDAVAEWYRILSLLQPCRGIQYAKPDEKYIPALIEAGLLKQLGATRYYVPRSIAFASEEVAKPESDAFDAVA